MLVVLSLLWFVAVAGLLAWLLRQQRGHVLPRVRRLPGAQLPSVTVIIPARNEEDKIDRCVSGILAQTYPRDRLQVIVVDDHSTDRTAEIVQGLAARDGRLRLLRASELPEGWKGKPHACWDGAAAAEGEWLLFIDADTLPAPRMLRRAMGLALGRRVDMLSVNPFQVMGTFWERVVLPTHFLMFALSMDIHRVNDPAQPDAVANGQFILIRRAAYDAVRGHEAVRQEILEDVALARVVKGAGHRLLVTPGLGLIRTRMYTSLREIWDGFGKNTVDLVGGVRNAVLGALLMALFGWAPILLTAACVVRLAEGRADALTKVALGLALLGSAAVLVAHAIMERYNRLPLRYGLLFPLGHSMSAALTLSSVYRRLRGRNEWKGRVYDEASPASGA